MKKYVDPEMNVVLFDDRTFVNNGVGTIESNLNDGTTTTPIEKGGLKTEEGEEIS